KALDRASERSEGDEPDGRRSVSRQPNSHSGQERVMSPQLLGNGSPALGSADKAGCRVWERIPCDLESSCQPITAREGGTGWDARVQAISLGGVAVVLRRRFEPGSGLSIGLPAAGSSPPLTLLVRVMRTERLADGQWLLGCSFPSPLGEEEMQGLLARA